MLMLSWIVSILKKIPYQLYLLVGLVVSVWLYGVWQFNRGEAYVQNMWDQDVARMTAVMEDLESRSLTVNMIIDTQWKTKTETIYTKGKDIIHEIPVYIPQDTPDLPGGFRVLHDAAVNSEVPGTSGGVEAAPVPVATATETIVTNYTQCLVWREEVVAWRQWYQGQAQLWKQDRSK